MRLSPVLKSDTWGTLVRRNRERLGYSQERLGELLGISKRTVGRWEKDQTRPESVDIAYAAARTLSVDTAPAMRLAGFAPSAAESEAEDPYAFVREMGLDPDSRVVQRILNMEGISEDLRMRALRRERELQLRDEQRRLEDLEWTIQQQAG